jgi:hypothetical protein
MSQPPKTRTTDEILRNYCELTKVTTISTPFIQYRHCEMQKFEFKEETQLDSTPHVTCGTEDESREYHRATEEYY